jgi:hypothetical protein
MGEFYSEWGRYEVEITVPSTYVVGATGVLQTDSEIAWLQQREAETRRWLLENGPDPAWDTTSTAPRKPSALYRIACMTLRGLRTPGMRC